MDTNNPNNELLNAISQIVKEELSQVKDEVSELRNEMSTRFNKVDERLDTLEANLKDAFKDIAIGQDRLEEHVAMYHVRGAVMQAMQQK